MTVRDLLRARDLLAAAVTPLALRLSACSSGGPEAAEAPSPSRTSASAEPSETPAVDEPVADGQHLVTRGSSVLGPEGWQGGRTDEGSVDETLASLDPRVAQLLGPQVQAAASQDVAGLLLDLGGIDTGDTTDTTTFSVLGSPPGPIEQSVSQPEQVFTSAGGTSTTGEHELPLGQERRRRGDAGLPAPGLSARPEPRQWQQPCHDAPVAADEGPREPGENQEAARSRRRFAWGVGLVVLANVAVVLSGSTSQGGTVVVLAFFVTLVSVALLSGVLRR